MLHWAGAARMLHAALVGVFMATCGQLKALSRAEYVVHHCDHLRRGSNPLLLASPQVSEVELMLAYLGA